MFLKQAIPKALRCLRTGFVGLTVFQFSLGVPLVSPVQAQGEPPARTPIKHVIIVVGENRTFDHLFGLYKPKAGQTVSNILSQLRSRK